MKELIILGVQFLIFILYIIYVYKNFKILPSISDSWYYLDGRKKLIFTIFCWSLSITMVLYNNLILFLSGVFLAFTGAAGPFKSKMTKWIHNINAGLSVLFAFYYLYYSGIQYIPIIWLILIPILSLKLTKNKIWWIEIISFLLVFGGMFLLFTKMF